MFCSQSPFIHSGCPQVSVNLSFPEFNYCSGVAFVVVNTPKLQVVVPEASPDIAAPDVQCIDVEPITDVHFGGKSLTGTFGLASGVSSCDFGLYRLQYALNIPCPLSGLAGSWPLMQNEVKIGRLVFNVSGCSLNIEAYASCAGGVVVETCIDKHFEGDQIDIPVLGSGDEHIFDIQNDNCNMAGSIKLRIPKISLYRKAVLVVTRHDAAWAFSLKPRGTPCSMSTVSMYLHIPSPSGFGFTFNHTPESELMVTRNNWVWSVLWPSLKMYTGSNGLPGARGTYYGCYSAGERVPCLISGTMGKNGPTGSRGLDGHTGSVFCLVGRTGPTGIAVGSEGGADCTGEGDVYPARYQNGGVAISLYMRMSGLFGNARLVFGVIGQELEIYRRRYVDPYDGSVEDEAEVYVDDIVSSKYLESVHFVGTC